MRFDFERNVIVFLIFVLYSTAVGEGIGLSVEISTAIGISISIGVTPSSTSSSSLPPSSHPFSTTSPPQTTSPPTTLQLSSTSSATSTFPPSPTSLPPSTTLCPLSSSTSFPTTETTSIPSTTVLISTTEIPLSSSTSSPSTTSHFTTNIEETTTTLGPSESSTEAAVSTIPNEESTTFPPSIESTQSPSSSFLESTSIPTSSEITTNLPETTSTELPSTTTEFPSTSTSLPLTTLTPTTTESITTVLEETSTDFGSTTTPPSTEIPTTTILPATSTIIIATELETTTTTSTPTTTTTETPTTILPTSTSAPLSTTVVPSSPFPTKTAIIPIESVDMILKSPNATLSSEEANVLLQSIGEQYEQIQKESNLFSTLERLVSAVMRNSSEDFKLETELISITACKFDSNNSISLFFQGSKSQAFVPQEILKSLDGSQAVLTSFDFNPFEKVSNESIFAPVTSLVLLDSFGSKIRARNTSKLFNITMPFAASPSNGFSCLYWDEEESMWSTEGCFADNSNLDIGVVHCLCNHLTNFTLGEKIPSFTSVGEQKASITSQTTWTNWMIGAIAGGTTLLLIIVVVLGFLIVKRKRRVLKRDAEALVTTDIDPSEISGLEEIGAGAHSTVYLATYKLGTVAVKKFPKEDVCGFSQERMILKQLHHPNLVQYLGCYTLNDSEICLVLEYVEYGTLLNVLRKEVLIENEDTLFNITFQLAGAMRYLEEIGIVHCDLSTRNILLKPSDTPGMLTVKIGDFGMARSEHDSASHLPSDFPVRWTAPEVLFTGAEAVSHRSDVWSFGVVLYEIFSRGRIPYGDLSNELVIKYVQSGVRLDWDGWTPKVREIAQSCFESDPGDRPSFEILSRAFKKWSGTDLDVPEQFKDGPVVDDYSFLRSFRHLRAGPRTTGTRTPSYNRADYNSRTPSFTSSKESSRSKYSFPPTRTPSFAPPKMGTTQL